MHACDLHRPTKLAVCSFSHSDIIQGSRNSKSRSSDPITIAFDPIVHFSIVPSGSIYMLNFEFIYSAVREIYRGSHNSKIGSRDPLVTTLT